ncbi:hypothetical protein I0C86_40485 [Plantactinospora sp. S1510]|uniref:Uncharacterized protein n=1 Tax=Plantactinospora alkalitolerans TaxID=2789879 RepID=A0ABS0HAF8_9ACTN|nr:hypothetical protein [Plantactinospora alkalitolerans]MBF9135159.1 hypothetical protein [Plantactinospora alkalitolerans]
MTASVLDVNDRFDATRANQIAEILRNQESLNDAIAAGTMRSLGNDRYQVTDGGYDNGEIFLRNAMGDVMPQHGLDVVEGNVALYSRYEE